MPVTIEALGIDRLSVGERLELIEQIWNSPPEEIDPQEVPNWHRAELVKRRQQAHAQPAVGKPWREVLGRLEGDPVSPFVNSPANDGPKCIQPESDLFS